ncbi:unnamed protein product, partial [Prorocentrum cordatum]
AAVARLALRAAWAPWCAGLERPPADSVDRWLLEQLAQPKAPGEAAGARDPLLPRPRLPRARACCCASCWRRCRSGAPAGPSGPLPGRRWRGTWQGPGGGSRAQGRRTQRSSLPAWGCWRPGCGSTGPRARGREALRSAPSAASSTSWPRTRARPAP